MVPETAYGWAESARRAPTGVLILSVLLTLLAAGLVVGGAYLAAARDAGWTAWVSALGAGPLLLFVSLHLLRLTGWAWRVMIALLALLGLSSLARAFTTAEMPIAPLCELALEVVALAYLLRAPVRHAFGRE